MITKSSMWSCGWQQSDIKLKVMGDEMAREL